MLKKEYSVDTSDDCPIAVAFTIDQSVSLIIMTSFAAKGAANRMRRTVGPRCNVSAENCSFLNDDLGVAGLSDL
jgi:hypothetical protein